MILRLLILLLSIAISKASFSQCQPFATALSGTGFDGAKALVQDDMGNFYISGQFSSVLVVGNDTLTLPHTDPGIFLAKFSSNGQPLWAKNFPGNLVGFEPVLARFGDIIYFATQFRDSISLDGMDYYAAEANAVIARLDTSGSVIWAKPISGPINIIDAAADRLGNLLLAGNASDTTWFPDSISSYTPATALFLLKVDRQGTVEWLLRDAAGGPFSQGRALAINAQNEILLAGTFRDTISLGQYPSGNVPGAVAPYLAKVSADGVPLWLNTAQSTASIHNIYDIEIDPFGNVYGAGWHFDTLTWGGVTASGADGHAILWKWGPNGGVKWAQQAGQRNVSFGQEAMRAVKYGPDGTIWCLGLLGPGAEIGGQSFPSMGAQEMKVIRYSTWNGNLLSVAEFPAVGNSGGRTLLFDQADNPVVLGYFSAPQYVLEGDTLINADSDTSNTDLFLARLCNDPGFVGQPKAVQERAGMTVFPNPASGDRVSLQFEQPFKGVVSVQDLNGRILLQIEVSSSPQQNIDIPLKSLPPGTYLLVTSGKERRRVQKLVRF